MQKDLNVIFPEEIVAGDDVYISLVLEKGNSAKDKGYNFRDFIEAKSNFPELVIIDFLTKQSVALSDAAYENKTVYLDPSRDEASRVEFIWHIKGGSSIRENGSRPGLYEVTAAFNNSEGFEDIDPAGPIRVKILPKSAPSINTVPIKVTLNETRRIETSDQLLWVLIRNRTIDFNRYKRYMDSVMCDDGVYSANKPSALQKTVFSYRLPFHNSSSYSLLKYATEYYMMQECGLVPNNLYEADGDINWDRLNDILANGRNLQDEFNRTARSDIDLSSIRNEYLEQLNGEGGYALPYFSLIQQKLSEVPLKEPHELPGILSFVNGDIQIPLNGELSKFPIPQACYGILKSKLIGPCMVELIWSYWHEEGGLVQTMNAISRRFQNVRGGSGKDPLANLNIDPLRPLNNLLWTYIEDERNRLSLNRRNLEYQYEYGLSLIGKAVPQLGVAEHRTNFIRAFHNLLKACVDFYNQANFTTVIPDAFPLLNHLREVHLILAEGAHNQYGDLPWTSRVEMLIQQWLLSRTEMREFLGGRIMVPYSEAWMDKVDTMKTLQDWNVPNITHFHDLGVFGEQLLLSIRFGSWNSTTSIGAQNAANWAHYWRNEVQRYIHAYNAVTGIDLGADITDARVQVATGEDRFLPPAVMIQKQAALQKSRQQYALQANVATPGLLLNRPATAMRSPSIPVLGQKKLNG
ncbi:hypothetical protein [Rufibacter aurantiacus]|uniref:hypothetical protein n=1 Tax=Rufibacter aurantiacus TaxID=2817374 RepID=UPI001B3014A8|nr:hypothetical protein [Rufibacter aurantiacus]